MVDGTAADGGGGTDGGVGRRTSGATAANTAAGLSLVDVDVVDGADKALAIDGVDDGNVGDDMDDGCGCDGADMEPLRR